MKFSIQVENCPEYAKDYEFIVARAVNGRLWFYGAWNEANRVAESLGDNALVLTNK